MTNTPNGGSGSISENDDAVRNLKSSETVVAAFHAEGFPSPPGDIAAVITAHVKSSTRDIPLNKIANMTPGSGPLGTSAAAGVNMFMNSLTPLQREAVKAGVNPLDSAAMMKLGGLFTSDANSFGRLSGRDGADGSSVRFDGLASHGFTQTQLQARDVAIKNGLGWAANNPDLLRLGPSAIQALADVHLQKESYERFKNGGLGDKAVVSGARWAKRTGTDYNEFSKTFDATQQTLPAADQQAHSQAVEQLFKAVGSEKPPTPAEVDAANDTFNKAMEPIKQRNPQAVQQIEREQQELKTVKEGRAVIASADKKEATADAMLAALNSGSPGGSATPKPETPPPASSSQTKPDASKPPKPSDRSAPKP